MIRARIWLLGLLCWASLSVAQPSSQPNPDAEARRLYESAEIHFHLQEFSLALDEYKAAYQLSSKPGLLFNIGQCYKQLKRYDEALKSYQAFLAALPNSSLRPEVEILIIETEQLRKEAISAASSQPTTLPATMLSTLPASTPTSIPISLPPDPRIKPLFYTALGGASLAIISSGIGLRAAFQSNDAEGIDPAIVVSKNKQAKIYGHISEGLFVSASVATIGAIVLKRNTQKIDTKQ
jgi:tetratricopeptide (TPR) repeat protein